MTGEAAPKVPSSYVSSVLEPLKKHLLQEKETEGDGKEQGGGCVWLAEGVVARVCTRYIASTRELLQVVAKTEAILSRLKKNKKQQTAAAAAAAAAATKGGSTSTKLNMSDADKIRLQLRLDIGAFASQARVLLGRKCRLKELDELEQLMTNKGNNKE
eukprot:CAMPEP_0185258264 /NCGR_PEP_ID=MMETSP1359-20130426/7214_1 /TAXON_ID=552665 /ORGANISM="Bigelowiella longifila, Strain CCMP242" /LENGTH=157 /DNA_ID=CAMNT_0027843689 /DNA_START=174 /DNA_END=647 /DNA_ORIENTATION=+